MSTGDQSTTVTRSELYRALVLVWSFLLFDFSRSVLRTPRSAGDWPGVIYVVASLAMVINYAIGSQRGSGSRSRAVWMTAAAAAAVGALAYFFR
jgi:hypothetical protein